MGRRSSGTVAASAKLGIAEMHIRGAVEMIVANINPYSTHLVVMAAEELLEHIVTEKGIKLSIDLDQQMTPKGAQYWREHKRDAYNFLKHGRRAYRPDKPTPDERKLLDMNDVQLVFNMGAYRDITGQWPAYMGAFYVAVALINDGMVRWDSSQELLEARARIGEFTRGEMRLMVGKALANS